MAVMAFWGAARVRHSRGWFENPRTGEWAVCMGIGVALILAFE